MNPSEAQAIFDELKAVVPSVKRAEPMSLHTTFAIGGPADFYAEIQNSEQLKTVISVCRTHSLPFFPLGRGSNLLIGDKGIRGFVVRLTGQFETITFDEESVCVGAGVSLPLLAKQCAERGLAGTEPLAGVPGTVGGGLMTNAGTPEGDIGSLVERVEVLDPAGEVRFVDKESLRFSYRHSSLQGQLVLRVWLKLRRGDKNVIIQKIQNQLERRAKNQPLGTRNVGSIFKNPSGDFAARLIEAAGLKGRRVGGAEVSTRHANFIVNTHRATADDVNRLIGLIQETVLEKFGVRLELEVWRAGE